MPDAQMHRQRLIDAAVIIAAKEYYGKEWKAMLARVMVMGKRSLVRRWEFTGLTREVFKHMVLDRNIKHAIGRREDQLIRDVLARA